VEEAEVVVPVQAPPALAEAGLEETTLMVVVAELAVLEHFELATAALEVELYQFGEEVHSELAKLLL
jgi:hypothetical protein